MLWGNPQKPGKATPCNRESTLSKHELTMANENEEKELERKLRSDFQNYAKNGIMPKSKKNDFWTPRDVFEALDERFGPYTLDAAASEENALVEDYYDKEANSLQQEWTGRVWCNPPYVKQDDKTTLKDWVLKAYDSVASGLAELVTLLIPAYTSNYYWHETIFPKASHLVFFRARLDFGGPHIRAGGASRQASVAVVFQNAWKGVGMQVLQMSNKGEWLTEETWNRRELELRLKNGIVAHGEYLNDGRFLVKRGSTANLKPRPSWRESEVRSRNKLIAEGTLREREGELVFTRDVTFNSPSMAATFVRAVQSNGKALWRATA